MNKLAETYIDLGNLNSAKKFSEKIINLSKTRFGENNFYEWKALGTLSKIYRAEENFSAALETDKKSLKIAEKVCGKKSLERLKSLDAIAGDHTAAGNIEEAIKIREKTLAEYQKILECNDAATTQLRTNLAENYLYAKRYDDAIKLCDETLANQNVPKYIGEKLSIYPCVTDLVKIKAKAQKLSGDDMKDENYRRLFWLHAFENYRQLIFAYEIKRSVIANLDEYDDASKSNWFAGMIPDYKEAATVAATYNIVNVFAFNCMEFCKCRNLIDKFDNVLVAKDYLLTPSEKK